MTLQHTSTLACPDCGGQDVRTMPADACVIVTACRFCHTTMRPKPGDCCVFCSYGDVPCPPIQQERDDAKAAGQA